MVIDRNSWHFKTFSFMARVSKRMFTFLDFKEDFRASIDLCTYVRTLVFTGPLVLALSIGMWGWFVYVFFIYPFLFQDFGPPTVVLQIALFVACVVIVFGHVIFFIVDFFRKRKERREEYLQNKVLTPEDFAPSKPSFLSILWSNIKGIKDRYCPVFEVK